MPADPKLAHSRRVMCTASVDLVQSRVARALLLLLLLLLLSCCCCNCRRKFCGLHASNPGHHFLRKFTVAEPTTATRYVI